MLKRIQMVGRIILCICTICAVFGFAYIDVDADASKGMKAVEICYYPEFNFFGDYPITIYLDKEKVGTLEAGSKIQKEYSLAPGKHKITAVKKKKKKVRDTVTFEVVEKEKYYCFEAFAPKRKEIIINRTETDMEILTMENHPKVLDSIDVAEDSWRKYGNKKIGIYNPDVNISDDPRIQGNYIAVVETGMSRWINSLEIMPTHIDGIDDKMKDAESAVKFIRDYVNLDKLKKYYGPGDSYKVFSEGKESDEDSRTYVMHYYTNEEGQKENYPEHLFVEIDKSSKAAPVNYIRIWWRGRPGSSRGGNYCTYEDWGRLL